MLLALSAAAEARAGSHPDSPVRGVNVNTSSAGQKKKGPKKKRRAEHNNWRI